MPSTVKAMIPDKAKAYIQAKTATGIGRAARDLVGELRAEWLHRTSLRHVGRFSGRHLKINVGCGPNSMPGWVNIDLVSTADLQLDIRKPLPLADESAAVIYSEHLFEHLEYPDEALRFLRESLRILEPGGIFSVGVPDTEWPVKAYANNDEEYFAFVREHHHPAWCTTRMHNLNYHFRQENRHKYAYDFETLAQALREMGFLQIERRPFNPDLDTEKRRVGTLYIDARKPDVTAKK